MHHDLFRLNSFAFTKPTVPTRAVAAALAGLAASVPLHADVVEFVPPGAQVSGHFGDAVAGIPDLNGDDLDDVLVGAPDEDHFGFTDNGRVIVYSGRTGGQVRIHFSPNGATNGNFGHAVAGIGDINGDGRGDYIVGAPGEVSFSGRCYVYSGANGTLLRTVGSPNSEVGGRFGWSISAVPDVTGDGVDEYLIGAPNEDVGSITDAGRAYLFNGATAALVRSHNSPNAEQFGDFGWSVTGGRQVNDGAFGKYAVGAPGESATGLPIESGRAYAFAGNTGVLDRTYVPTNPNQGARYGQCVAAVPNFFGNGRVDLAIGSPSQNVTPPKNGSGLAAGAVEIRSFGAGANYLKFNQPLSDVSDSNNFGHAIAGIPDMDGDGRGEALIGAPADLRAYIYKFPSSSNTLVLDETLTTPDQFGLNQFWSGAVAAVGDANGDGFGDYIIGGRGSDNFPNDPSEGGRAYLYRPVYNDGCGTVFSPLPVLQTGQNAVSTIGANAGGTISTCQGWSGNPGPDTWYRYTATCGGTLTFNTCVTSFDTLLAVYDGCNYTGPFLVCNLSVLLGCSDDSSDCETNGSSVTVTASAGDCFFVRLGGFNGASGTATLSVTCESCPADLNADGLVNAADLSALLGGWGTAAGDVNDDGTTNATDISVLLGSWGACP